ncbi:MAG: DoxX family membrane protein [Bacteroidetes bacterium]|nr:DoxX family membrane protein [Bacteroidota bacterium]
MDVHQLNRAGLFWITALRVLIGWHFLYEGMVKLFNPNWSSVGYLLDSEGIFKGIFYRIAASESLLAVADFLNVWGLIAIGLALILGLVEKPALWGGIALLSLYYLSHPPFPGLKYDLPSEGSYLVVNKVLIELVTLIVLLFFPTSQRIGLCRLIFKLKNSD